MSIVFSSSFNKLTEFNSSFDTGVLRICYVGKNRNNSFISKETFERCIPSIYNCPIVCRYDREADEIGAHDMEIVKRDDGSIKLVNVTHPVGVIPESANYWFEEVEEDNGTIREYLYVDALLWKRQEAYEKIKEDGITDQSMEISIKEGRMKDGVYVIDRLEFTAFCLLGTVKPCYESAALMTFSQEDFKAQLDEMMRDFKDSVTTMQLSEDSEEVSEEVDIHNQNNSEGGEEALDEKKLLEENFALAEQFRDELVDALSVEKTETIFGEMSRYWYMDYDDEVKEVYCYDSQDWKLYGFTYAMNGDNVVVDFESKKRKKFAITDFDEGEQASAFSAFYSLVTEQYTTNESQWTEKYQVASDSISTMETELGELRKYKSDIEQETNVREREGVFAQFEDLAGVEEFEALRDNCGEIAADDLTEKCFAIRGRNLHAKFSLNEQKAPKLMVEKTDAGKGDEPYGGIFAEYGIQRKQ
jgi:hypothetical protein